MRPSLEIIIFLIILMASYSCNEPLAPQESEKQPQTMKGMTAADILGNPEYLAISYGGYREKSRDIQPTVEELKEDMKILAAMGVRILRTYNTELQQASNLLKAIQQLKQADAEFEMYVMLGAWIKCKNANTAQPDHDAEDEAANAAEIARAIEMAKNHPDIVKIIAVGNEAMVKWAASYYVQPDVILKWVNHLQDLKEKGDLPKELWITSSDNFASWGGGGEEYHVPDLEALIKAVDYISLHTYPMHDTHYNPDFWGIFDVDEGLSDLEKIDKAMARAQEYAKNQYQNTSDYIKSLGVEKPIHIGETGWASFSNEHYGAQGSKATDEYKEGVYYRLMREWTNDAGIACFYFEAFDEIWKDAQNHLGSENHFGLFKIDGKAKFAIWELVDQGKFHGLKRGANPILKTYNGDKESLLRQVLLPPKK